MADGAEFGVRDKMEIEVIKHNFSVCKVTDYQEVSLDEEYCFIGKTNEECSLVCITKNVPSNTTAREDGWKAFRLKGTLDFSLIGILSKIAALLAEHEISIFAVSTYNTDYVLTKTDKFEEALALLRANGYKVIQS